MAAGEMIELSAAADDIDTTDQLNIFEGYQKVFIVNGANLKVADFINTKITVTAMTSGRAPAKGDILTQDQGTPDFAYMVVDFVNTARTEIYGYAYYGGAATTFTITDDITSNNAVGDMDPNPILAADVSAVTAKPHWYDWTAYPNIKLIDGGATRTYGSLPNSAYLGCLYRGRCVISGDPEHPHQWYMSRQTHPFDFAYVANDAGTPVKGGASDAGEIGDIVRALISYKDDYLIFGCATSIWYLAGDPAFGGSINELDLTVGMFGANSYCFDGEGSLYFWGTNGLYKTKIPGNPVCISEIQLPDLIDSEGANPTTHRITMGYDRKRLGILINITVLADGSNSNWFYDLRSEGFFPESYPDSSGAYSSFFYAANDNDYRDLLVGCRDGYIRKFNTALKSDNTTDDAAGVGTTAIGSYVNFGPFPLSKDPDRTGKLTAPNLITAGGGPGGSQNDSNNVSYKIYTANSAEKVIEDLAAASSPKAGGTFYGPGRNSRNKRPHKIKGAYAGIRLDNVTLDESWGFEKFIGTVVSSGRIK